jgi:hypothetical protein
MRTRDTATAYRRHVRTPSPWEIDAKVEATLTPEFNWKPIYDRWHKRLSLFVPLLRRALQKRLDTEEL